MISPDVLRRCPLFADLDDETLKAIAMATEEVCFEQGQFLFREGEPANHLYLMTDGEVDIQYVLGSGEHRTVDTLIAGDLLAWSSLVPPHETTALGVARTRTEALTIHAPTLRALCDANPILGYRVMSEMARVTSQRLQGARIQLAAQE